MIAKGTRKVVPVRDIKISDAWMDRSISEEGISALADNFEVIGQLNPITVRAVGKAGRVFELLAGRRRLEAMKKTGHKEIECKVVKCSDEEARIMSLSENLQTEKPSSREWADAYKELADLAEKRLTREQKQRRDRSAQNNLTQKAQQKRRSPEIPAPSAGNSGAGRPASLKQQAIREAAKTAGVSEREGRRQYKRADDLISLAKSAWEMGKITDKQADVLANMTKSEQRRELSKMASETQRATTDRRRSEIQQNATGAEAERATIRTLRELVEQAKKWKSDTTLFLRYVDGRALNWGNVFQGAGVTSEDLLPCMEQMSEFYEFLAAD